MNTIKQYINYGIGLFFSLLFTGKLYNATHDWVEDMFAQDYGDFWVPVLLFLWFFACMAVVAALGTYLATYVSTIIRVYRTVGRPPNGRP